MNTRSIFCFPAVLSVLLLCGCYKQAPVQSTAFLPAPKSVVAKDNSIVTGADQVKTYLPYLLGKRVGMVVNPTSVIGKAPSVDSLQSLGVNIVKIFGPEHGFRGDASAGVKVADAIDSKTGIEVVSLYGKNSKPTKEHLENIDLMIFDIQDVGARFYTYTITMHRVMEACAENGVELMILDRPNPNGYLVDGPILDMSLKSGIGIHPVPIAHGMTVGEYAQMINGEGWLANGKICKLNIIKIKNYSHDMAYTLPVAPSPNLNTQQSILLYPSLCLFEGTIISQGRGTHFPFTVLGNPELKGKYEFSFTPESIKGMSETPLHQDKACYGLDLREYSAEALRKEGRLNLQWLIGLYQAYPDKEKFFDYKQSNQIGNFDKLAGTRQLKEQIIAGVPEAEIRKSWEPGLSQYKEMRRKYLLYP
ncbi:exo-beta-N-acetylmuramidase NamZ family protein [Pontibacter sp. MBLB2868]|uniref:exo-beta-N-acetylmuramidase NamZ family protein n=1 Tax=Pontibacter sp. MBLB2868 TaxID=3451555 RepID=UPI003F74FD78